MGGRLPFVGGDPVSSRAGRAAGLGAWLPPKAPLPVPCPWLSMASLKGRVHAIGGLKLEKSEVVNVHYAYDPAADAWATCAPMRTQRFAPAVVALGEKLYAFGGGDPSSQVPLSIAEAYDPVADRWEARTPMHTARSWAAAAAAEGRIYVLGGRGGKETAAANEAYDPAGDSWTSRSPLVAGRCGIAAVGLRETLYLCGGAGDDAEGLATVEAYEPETDRYTPLPPMPTARAFAGAAADLGMVRVIGGHTFWVEENVAANEAYSPKLGVWTSDDPIPQGEEGPTTAIAAIAEPLATSVYALQHLYTTGQTRTLQYLTAPLAGDAAES
jgi:Kelch motif